MNQIEREKKIINKNRELFKLLDSELTEKDLLSFGDMHQKKKKKKKNAPAPREDALAQCKKWRLRTATGSNTFRASFYILFFFYNQYIFLYTLV